MRVKSFTVAGMGYTIHYLRGTVVDIEKIIETKVSGGGGVDTNGKPKPVVITTQTIIHETIYISDGTDTEKVVKLQNWDTSIRKNHQILVVSIQKGPYHPYVAIKNFTTDIEQIDKNALSWLSYKLEWVCLLPLSSIPLFFIADEVIALGFTASFLVFSIFKFIKNSRIRKRKLNAELREFLDSQKRQSNTTLI
jgi:hypothetical protein